MTTTKDQYGGEWGEHPKYPSSDWKYEVSNGDTRLGYWEWVGSQGVVWGEHPDFPTSNWRDEVSNDDTRLDYWAWVESKRVTVSPRHQRTETIDRR